MERVLALESIADDDLLRRLSDLLRQSRHVEPDLVAHIGEVDARRLYAREACSSMFAYCTERLHLSEAEAYLRITTARVARAYPDVLAMLADGRLHLSGIAKLAPHLTPENAVALLGRASYSSKRQIEELLAEIAPRPDVPEAVRRLPDRRPTAAAPDTRDVPQAVVALRLSDQGPIAVDPASPFASPGPEGVTRGEPGTRRGEPGTREEDPPACELRPDGVASLRLSDGGIVEPLAPGRYKVQFTASAALHDKLRRLQALISSPLAGGDLASIIEEAVTEKLERLEARRFGRCKGPRRDLRQTETSPRSRHVPAAVRRAVLERDDVRCRYVDSQGRRCSARNRLEFHHRHPFGRGGDHAPANISLLCKVHNAYLAEHDYGRAGTSLGRPPG